MNVLLARGLAIAGWTALVLQCYLSIDLQMQLGHTAGFGLLMYTGYFTILTNAFCALEAGATHVDTSVLGIGERNGITSLGGLVARMYVHNPDQVRAKYNLPLLREIDNLVASLVDVDVPFNNYITGFTAFTHKAGIHAKAILNNPSTYEILDPADFGLSRYIHVAHRLTGWNAIKERAEQLQLNLSDDDVKKVTAQIKSLADQKRLTLDDVDFLLREYHGAMVSGEMIETIDHWAA